MPRSVHSVGLFFSLSVNDRCAGLATARAKAEEEDDAGDHGYEGDARAESSYGAIRETAVIGRLWSGCGRGCVIFDRAKTAMRAIDTHLQAQAAHRMQIDRPGRIS